MHEYPGQTGMLTIYPSPPKPHRNFAISALVLGIVGAVFGLIPLTFIVAWICAVLAFIFGLFGRKHGLGKAGVVLGVIAVGLGVWGAVIVNKATTEFTNDLDSYNACVQAATTLDEISAC